jgi:CheY-like chemotaxis protein
VEDLLNILLDMSKLDSGHVSPDFQQVQLAPLMTALRDELAPLAAREGLSFTLVPCSLTVYSDPRLLRRLMQNFLTNACRYTPSGRVLFGARRRNAMVELQVHDTGVGIPREKLDEIFEEFRRLESAEGGRKGYGLGLSIVRRISRLLDCQIQVRSEPGQGSCFSVLVPLADLKARSTRPPASGLLLASAVDNVRVLVVDNDDAVLDGMTRLLRTWQCQAVAVADRNDAQTHIARSGFRPDILLADYHLNDGDLGTDLIVDIRDQLGAEIPAAVITADRSPEVQAAVRRLPSVSLLTKPIKPARLRALIASVRR